jgi:hypothetical protein
MSYHSLLAHKAVLPPSRELFFWDFDGTLCDSVRETGHTGFLSCLYLWPQFRAYGGGDFTLDVHAPPAVIEGFKLIRPLLHTGWEAAVMVRLLIEAGDTAASEETAKRIGAEWTASTCEEHLQRWAASAGGSAVTKQNVMDAFNTVRQQWIAADLAGWVTMHDAYPLPLAAFRVLAAEVPEQTYIVTTKGAEFVQVILRHWGVHGFADAHIYGLGSGDKLETIHRVTKEHEVAATASAGHAADRMRSEGKLVRCVAFISLCVCAVV